MSGHAYLVVRAVVAEADRSDFDTWYRAEHLPDAAKAFAAQRAWRAWSRSDIQDPLTTLNPLYSVGRQLVETMQTHLGLSGRGGAPARARRGWSEVGIPAAASGSTPIRTNSRAACGSAS